MADKIAYKVITNVVRDRLQGQIGYCIGHIKHLQGELSKLPCDKSHSIVSKIFLEVHDLMDIEKEEVLIDEKGKIEQGEVR